MRPGHRIGVRRPDRESRLRGAIAIDVSHEQHVGETCGPILVEPEAHACHVLASGILEGAEEKVPDGQVTIVPSVLAVFMMQAVHLRTLDEEAEGMWCPDVPVERDTE